MHLFAKITVLTAVLLLGVVLGSFLSPVKIPAEIGENQAIPVTDREYFQTVQNLIDSANSSIKVIMYSINYYPEYPDSRGHMLFFDLEEAAERGVDIKIITDQTPTEKPVLSILKDMGVEVKYDSKDVTTHAKLIIIDSKIVIIGSTNWSYYSIDKNHEANVLIRSPSIAKNFEGYFGSIWVES
ncbi:MAG: phospholipase D-like domain-containing protein [Candidatus Aenigmarchaeota archaeon]